jgi:hypothetical protein
MEENSPQVDHDAIRDAAVPYATPKAELNVGKLDVNVPLILAISAVSIIGLVVTTILVDAWYKSTETEIVAQKWEESPNIWLNQLRSDQKANLEINHRIPNSRRRHVPVTEAMRILAENNGKVPQ